MFRSYSELCGLRTFKERYSYLQLGGKVGRETFGYDRYLNQIFYRSEEWKYCKRQIIIRDNGCDLGCEGYELNSRILIHHIIPITKDDIIQRNPIIFDPENLITTSHNTHQAIHYGDENLLIMAPIERTKNDTCPWKNLI
ncbi:MAG: hypothetical protein GX660_04230 [Clostridiaceae bacterium]|nr:hypothetical protein [Clostridiaceae bacterium]